MAAAQGSQALTPPPGRSRRIAPFDIDLVLDRVHRTVRGLPKAALFELAEEGYDSPFEQLVACVISIRTRDEVTLPAARALFEAARTPQEIRDLGIGALADRIQGCTFHRQKAERIHRMARRVLEEHGGEVPCDFPSLLAFSGVGPKCANLILGISCGIEAIGVDIHVHRVTNRWGYVRGRTPELTLLQLQKKLPRRYWTSLNRMLVPFGKHVCTGKNPYCSRCPVEDMCAQNGVTRHR